MTEQDKQSLLRFHKELKSFCESIDWHCDAGDGNEKLDCPFAYYCYTLPMSLKNEEITEAFDALNNRDLPTGICAQVLAHRRSVYPELCRDTPSTQNE